MDLLDCFILEFIDGVFELFPADIFGLLAFAMPVSEYSALMLFQLYLSLQLLDVILHLNAAPFHLVQLFSISLVLALYILSLFFLVSKLVLPLLQLLFVPFFQLMTFFLCYLQLNV